MEERFIKMEEDVSERERVRLIEEKRQREAEEKRKKAAIERAKKEQKCMGSCGK